MTIGFVDTAKGEPMGRPGENRPRWRSGFIVKFSPHKQGCTVFNL